MKKGFTLIEMIVALGIFSIVAVVALGALVRIVSANRKAQTLQSSITNLNFALDSMSRELRTGKNYNCTATPTYGYSGSTIAKLRCDGLSSGTSGDKVLAFLSSKTSTVGGNCNLAIAYRFRNAGSGTWALEKATQQDCGSTIGSGSFSSIIDPNVTITGYYIDVNEANYAKGTMRISGYAGVRERDKTYFDVQTTISARVR